MATTEVRGNISELLSDGNASGTELEEVYADTDGSEVAPLIMEPKLAKLKSCPTFSCSSRTVLSWLKMNLLLILTMVSVITGLVIGISVGKVNIPKTSEHYQWILQLLSFPGEIFLRMLKMLILPLIVFSLISGLGSLEAKVAGSLGWKTVLYYMTTTFAAVILGLILVCTIKPGARGFQMACDNATSRGAGNNLNTLDSVLDLIRNMLPDNLFAATFQQAETHYVIENVTDFDKCLLLHNLTRDDINYTQTQEFIKDNNSLSNFSSPVKCYQIQSFLEELGLSCENAIDSRKIVIIGTREGLNILGIIIFTIAFGIVLGQLGPSGKAIVAGVGVLNEAILKLISLVMWYSPIGIASIVAGKLAEVEDFSELLREIGLYFVTVMVGLSIHSLITLPLLYTIMTRSNPLKIVRATMQALVTAFGTSSSSATLPVTIQNLEHNFNADPRVTRFMLPVGATINMDGTALYEAVAAIFIAQTQGVPLTFSKIIIISITAMCASIGAAGVPQAGLFTLVLVVVAAGLNPDNIALILAVDWLLDRFRTTVNVLGDTFGVGIVQHYSRKQLGPLPSTSDHSTTAFSTLPDTLASQHHDSYDQLHVSSDGVGNTKNQLSQYGSALAYDSDSPPSHIIPSPDTLRRSLP